MDLRKVILQEHSKSQALKIVRHVGSDRNKFRNLVDIFLAGPYRITQRAAWPLGICVEHHPALISPHLKSILNYLKTPGIHDSVKRNTIRLLQFIEIPKRYQGQVADLCFTFLQDTKEPVAIRVFSMTVLNAVSRDNPELKRELKIIVEDHLPFASAAFIARAKKVLKG